MLYKRLSYFNHATIIYLPGYDCWRRTPIMKVRTRPLTSIAALHCWPINTLVPVLEITIPALYSFSTKNTKKERWVQMASLLNVRSSSPSSSSMANLLIPFQVSFNSLFHLCKHFPDSAELCLVLDFKISVINSQIAM